MRELHAVPRDVPPSHLGQDIYSPPPGRSATFCIVPASRPVCPVRRSGHSRSACCCGTREPPRPVYYGSRGCCRRARLDSHIRHRAAGRRALAPGRPEQRARRRLILVAFRPHSNGAGSGRLPRRGHRRAHQDLSDCRGDVREYSRLPLPRDAFDSSPGHSGSGSRSPPSRCLSCLPPRWLPSTGKGLRFCSATPCCRAQS